MPSQRPGLLKSARRPIGPGLAGNASGEATRKRLLDAATRLFAERGFEGVTVRDITRAASANVSSVNYHFGGKLGLYEAARPGPVARGLGEPS